MYQINQIMAGYQRVPYLLRLERLFTNHNRKFDSKVARADRPNMAVSKAVGASQVSSSKILSCHQNIARSVRMARYPTPKPTVGRKPEPVGNPCKFVPKKAQATSAPTRGNTTRPVKSNDKKCPGRFSGNENVGWISGSTLKT